MKKTNEWLTDINDTLTARGAIYGSAATNHRRISELWSGYLDTYISPEQAAMCMLLVKVSRLSESSQHDDSLKDLVGYACVYRKIIAELNDNSESDKELL
jgi:hypothetical protein